MAATKTKKGAALMRTQYEPGHKGTPILEVLNVTLDTGAATITLADDCDTVKEALGVAIGPGDANAVDCWAAISTVTTPNDTITITGAGSEVMDVFIFGKA